MNNVDVSALLQQRQTAFIETRTIIEKNVNEFLESLNSLDGDIQQKCGVQPGITAKNILSELWSDDFNLEVYNQQLAGFKNYVEQVRAICNQLNQEALACLQS